MNRHSNKTIKYFQIIITDKKNNRRDINHHNNWCKNIRYN